ncbi:MAG: hypothetical protein WBM86_18315 [Waterburya sp.]
MARKKSKKSQLDPATKNFNQGVAILHRHPMFAPLLYHANLAYIPQVPQQRK